MCIRYLCVIVSLIHHITWSAMTAHYSFLSLRQPPPKRHMYNQELPRVDRVTLIYSWYNQLITTLPKHTHGHSVDLQWPLLWFRLLIMVADLFFSLSVGVHFTQKSLHNWQSIEIFSAIVITCYKNSVVTTQSYFANVSIVWTCRYINFDLPCVVKGYAWAFLWAVLNTKSDDSENCMPSSLYTPLIV